LASDSAPEILMLLPDEPGQYSTGGAVRAWHFLAQMCGLGRLTGFVLSRGVSGETILAKGKRCCIVRMPSDAAVPVTPSWRRYAQILLRPWQNRGRQLLLAGHNICAQRSAAAGFKFGHWCYGLYLLLLFSLLRRLTSLDPTDCHALQALESVGSNEPDYGVSDGCKTPGSFLSLSSSCSGSDSDSSMDACVLLDDDAQSFGH